MVDNIRGADFNGRYLRLALRAGEPQRLLGALATEMLFLASQGGRSGRRARQLEVRLARVAERCSDEAFARTWLHLADGAASFFEGRFAHAGRTLAQSEKIFAEGPRGLTYERNNTRIFRIHALRLLGAFHEQAALIREFVRGGRQRGDHYLVTTLGLLAGPSLLAHGDLDAARAQLHEAPWSPPRQGFHVQDWNHLRARAELALFEGAGGAAVAALAPAFAELLRSKLLRVQIVRADALALAGRLELASGRCAGSAHARARVTGLVRRLEAEQTGYARVYAALLAAGLASQDPRRDRAVVVAQLQRAVEAALASGMALHAAAAQDRLGLLLGGDEGAARRAAARAYAVAERLVDPERMFEMVAPGTLPGPGRRAVSGEASRG
jgi:hypothetical protein